MRVLVKLPGRGFQGIFLLALLQSVSVVHLINTSAAAKFHTNEMVELQRSLARYRHLLGHDNSKSRRDSLQVDEKRTEQEVQTKTAGGEVKEVDMPGEVFQGVQNVETEVLKQPHAENEMENENLNSETAEGLEQGISATKAEESQKSAEQLEGTDKRVEDLEKSATQQEGNFEEKQVEEPQTKTEEAESNLEAKTEDKESTSEVSDPESKTEEPESKTEDPESKAEELEPKTEDPESKVEELEPNKTDEAKSETEEPDKQEQEQNKEKEPGSMTDEQQHGGEEQTVVEEEHTEEEKPFVFPEPHLLGPTIKDWDEQRARWLDANPHMKALPDGKPRVLIVTGSQPDPCRSPVGDNFNVKSLKLKIDYARMHNYEIYYSFAWLDPQFGSYWVKLPLIRKLMLTHPEIEWFFWIDSDAVFTDMLFEAPFHQYEGSNMIMWAWEYGFYTKKSWIAFNAGVFLIRNCQWTLDLIDKWSPMGPEGPVRDEYGKILTAYLSDRIENYPADDQSALAYLILTDDAVKSKVKLIDLSEYMVSGWWVQVVHTYENSMEKYHPGLGDPRWPWITHFTGCSPCGGHQGDPDYEKCIENIERAYNFADNQVLAYMGMQHESLSSPVVIRTRNETDRPLDFVGVNPWEERIAQLAAATAAAEGGSS